MILRFGFSAAQVPADGICAHFAHLIAGILCHNILILWYFLAITST